ncbi:MAG: hypothetical protein RMY64_05080 [Nostoc sp. DedQUE08]|uniref:hypothetical protein n=1 Tax=unclassified Nostoc TaxID=2593658 RepID=UPI002AD52A49|nr:MULTISPECIES: hypothetical protein [unclassified Nostoc]MDZ8065001.1 hypothetical protein [Nostoc sp. DedQUE08]MDZ8091691.1 hypothetical protein [Nostoc sp. DedQUE05]
MRKPPKDKEGRSSVDCTIWSSPSGETHAPRAIHPDNRPLFVVGLINSELSSECIGAIPIATEPTVLPSQWLVD